jgi:hypothetical protein
VNADACALYGILSWMYNHRFVSANAGLHQASKFASGFDARKGYAVIGSEGARRNRRFCSNVI